ncbi:lon protease-like protein, mitochondrial [Sesbania bispinosa]|nr:lon protease-like protein, mitochondrial [Sesbania bispinosa]
MEGVVWQWWRVLGGDGSDEGCWVCRGSERCQVTTWWRVGGGRCRGCISQKW